MAEIRQFLWMRHLRAEPSVHVLRFKRGRLTQSGRGLAFWFLPMSASVAEVPMDDRDLHFLFHARSRDFQDVTVQGVAAWRVTDPERLGAFLGATGISAAELRTRAGAPEFLLSVLDFLLMDDASVIAFCEAEGYAYTAPLAARSALPGGAERHWT